MKKLISILLAAVLFCGILSGCSTSVSSTADTQNNDQNSVKSSQEEPITIRIGASITPHSEILKAADELLRDKGYQLDIVEFDDYIMPNLNVESGELDKLPGALPAAVAEAKSVLDTTRDPQLSDIVLDRWMYRDMAQVAEDTGSQFLRGYVETQIDAANLRALIRTLRMGKNADFLAGVLFESGTVVPAAILAAANHPAGGLNEIYGPTRFAQAAEAGEAALKGGSLTGFEKRCDDAVSDYLAGAQMIPFGEAPLLAYLAARETEYTNIRILLMGRAAGLSPEVIRSRLRRTCA